MKVAIIGAGVAGLSCAHELEKHGVKATIYEKNSFIGEAYPHITAVLSIAHRPIKDVVKYFNNEFDISLSPQNILSKAIHHSPKITTTIKGNLGYTFSNTKEPNSVKKQIYSSLKNTEIKLNTLGDYSVLSKEYDFVVISTGNYAYAHEMGCWQEWLKTYVRGADVLGEFDPEAVEMWINKDYCKNGYAYLTAFEKKRASIILMVPDVNEKEIDHYWDLFLYSENIKYTIVEEFKIEHRAGFVYPHNFDNIYFVGNADGGIDPFLGFGILNAITTGVSAARSIIKGKSYEKMLKDIVKRTHQLRQFRKVYDTMTNKDCDNLIAAIGVPGIRQLLYKSPINVAKYGAFASKFLLKGKGSK